MARITAGAHFVQSSVSIENALYHDERLAEVVAVGVPDEKLGEVVAAVVSTKPAFRDQVKEAELIELARSRYGRGLIRSADLSDLSVGCRTSQSLSWL